MAEPFSVWCRVFRTELAKFPVRRSWIDQPSGREPKSANQMGQVLVRCLAVDIRSRKAHQWSASPVDAVLTGSRSSPRDPQAAGEPMATTVPESAQIQSVPAALGSVGGSNVQTSSNAGCNEIRRPSRFKGADEGIRIMPSVHGCAHTDFRSDRTHCIGHVLADALAGQANGWCTRVGICGPAGTNVR